MRVQALIDVKALEHNLQRVRSLAPAAKVLTMIKANAYGHGILQCARALEADFLGVATLEEASLLRQEGISKRIVLAPGFQNQAELEQVIALELDTVVHYPHQIELLQNYRGQAGVRVWFKFNTGMHRLGFAVEQVPVYLSHLERLAQVEIVALMSHLASADAQNHEHPKQQLERFYRLTEHLPYPRSILNSAGIINYPWYHDDIVRPGLLVYGASPCEHLDIEALQLKPVMTLAAQVLAKIQVAAGASVGYGGAWVAEKPSEIAVIACGYGDGYPQLPKAGQVYYQGQLLPVVGRVSMDFLTVDISTCEHLLDVGSMVELWGKHWRINDAAQAIGISCYPLLTGVMARVPRISV